jgi:hypothetical protein
MNLPTSKENKLVNVRFTYESGHVFELDKENSLNFQMNMDDTSIMGVRGHQFKPVDWNLIFPIGNRNDFPPKGHVRIIGVGNKSDWNELVEVKNIEKRCKEIFSKFESDDAYYTDLKFFWLKYDDGREEQMADLVWKEKK